MNNAVYALPGFMPPAAPKWKSELRTKEDGSIKLLIHCSNKQDDTVYYSIDVPGFHFGIIPDPKYFSDNDYPAEIQERVDKFDQYLERGVIELPEDVEIPVRVFNGTPVRINELPDQDQQMYYWILTVPAYILPVGLLDVSVSVNGTVLSYIVQRPEFSIHAPLSQHNKIYK